MKAKELKETRASLSKEIFVLDHYIEEMRLFHNKIVNQILEHKVLEEAFPNAEFRKVKTWENDFGIKIFFKGEEGFTVNPITLSYAQLFEELKHRRIDILNWLNNPSNLIPNT